MEGFFSFLWVSNTALCVHAHIHSILFCPFVFQQTLVASVSWLSEATLTVGVQRSLHGTGSIPLGYKPRNGDAGSDSSSVSDGFGTSILIFTSINLYQFIIHFVLFENMNKDNSRENSIMSSEYPSPFSRLS